MSDPPQFSYVLPTDSEERRRLDLQHRCITLICGGLYYPPDVVEAVLSAPANPSHAILDIGTGSGAWAEDMARAFPDADVTGVDIVPPKATSSTPPNCRFRFEDVNKGFKHYDKRYSLVQMRMMSHGVDDFRGAIHNVAEILLPGGILLLGGGSLDVYNEDKESLPTVKEGEEGWCAIKSILKVYYEVISNRFDLNINNKWLGYLRGDDVYDPSSLGEKWFYVPIGSWRSSVPGHSPAEVEAGQLMAENLKKMLPIMVGVILKNGVLDPNPDTFDRWIKLATKEIDEMKPRVYMYVTSVWVKRSNVSWAGPTEPTG